METPVVTAVKVTAPFTLDVTFEDGKRHTFEMDLSRRGGAFEALKDPVKWQKLVEESDAAEKQRRTRKNRDARV